MYPNGNNSNCESQQQPFMFGGHTPAGRYSSASSFQNSRGRTDSVRDCMSWTNSLPTELQGNSNYYWSGMGGSVPSYNYMMPGQPQQMYTMPVQPQQQMSSMIRPPPQAPVAFMSIPGQGGKGDIQPISIPIQVGASGSQFGPLPVMKPLIINAAKPTSGNGVAEPFTFQISPDQYFGGR